MIRKLSLMSWLGHTAAVTVIPARSGDSDVQWKDLSSPLIGESEGDPLKQKKVMVLVVGK